MRAMILAAGRGERMGVLTQHTPKPLLRLNGRYLIEYMILNLQQANITEIIINVAYLGDQIIAALGDGSQYGVTITYSKESERLETGGGIFKALPFFKGQPFVVVSGDIVTDFPMHTLPHDLKAYAHLVMVDNPDFHAQGDFGLQHHLIDLEAKPTLTFANIGVYHPDLFQSCEPGHFRLSALLKPAIAKHSVTGERYQGRWHNVGTAEELARLGR
jgi:MurNAc alpha-1-phosphate uridylyltransferase